MSYRMEFSASNNEAEYESLIAGLRLSQSIGAHEISAFSDSQLVTSQFHGEYEAKNERMEAYIAVLQEIAQQFDKFKLTKIPRRDYTSADALALLALSGVTTTRRHIDPLSKGIDLHRDNIPRIGVTTTRSRARRDSQDLDDETNCKLNDQPTPSTSHVRTRRTATTATIPEEAVHETNNEAHDAFRKKLEARPDWIIPIVKYIKDGELPAER